MTHLFILFICNVAIAATHCAIESELDVLPTVFQVLLSSSKVIETKLTILKNLQKESLILVQKVDSTLKQKKLQNITIPEIRDETCSLNQSLTALTSTMSTIKNDVRLSASAPTPLRSFLENITPHLNSDIAVTKDQMTQEATQNKQPINSCTKDFALMIDEYIAQLSTQILDTEDHLEAFGHICFEHNVWQESQEDFNMSDISA